MPGSLLVPSTDSLAQISNSRAQMRQQFESALLAITGDTRLFWMAQSGDTTTSTGKSLNAGTITWDATVASRLSALGLGYAQTFDGAANVGKIPDNDIYSFGDSSTDSAFSVIALANVTNTANYRTFGAKFANTSLLREWWFTVTNADTLRLDLFDESSDGNPRTISSTAVTMGSTVLFGATYSAATGGATAANDITLYQNGIVKASAATNDVAYVAMENTAAVVTVGARGVTNNSTFDSYMQGSEDLLVVCQKNLSASDHWAIYKLCKAYFNF